ncbi:subtilisin-like protease, partial [Olea europaea subsp. europaea]
MVGLTSIGPSSLEPNTLKPDITKPKLNNLVAWSESISSTILFIDDWVVEYNVVSQTSMSYPLVATVIALIRAYCIQNRAVPP